MDRLRNICENLNYCKLEVNYSDICKIHTQNGTNPSHSIRVRGGGTRQ